MLDLIIEISIPLFILFVFALICILAIRLFFYISLYFAKKSYNKLKQKINEKRKKKPYFPIEDEIIRGKKKEKEAEKTQLINVEKITLDLKNPKKRISQTRVVGIKKPIGFWTSLVLGKNLSNLVQEASFINKVKKEGFWVSLVEAQKQGRAMGTQKYTGRTRV